MICSPKTADFANPAQFGRDNQDKISQNLTSICTPMIEPAIPGKETVRITLPSRRPAETISGNGESGRINSSIRPLDDAVPSSVVAASNSEPPLVRRSRAPPDTETSRISVLPRPAKASVTIPALVRNTVGNRAMIDGVPKSLCWALVGVSAGVLLVEIWNYIS